MKLKLIGFFAIVLCTLFCKPVYSQVSVASTDGYTVHITVNPVAVNPSTTTNCSNGSGYTYTVTMHYVITFTGSNIPSNLYTLQGNLGCGPSSLYYGLPTSGATGNVNTATGATANSDCATATPSSLLCNSTTIFIQGPGIPAASQNQVITFAAAGPLPVTFTSFNTEAQKEKVKIMWSTVSEINNDYFSIERSTDGAIWASIKTIKGAINSSSLINYETFDNNPITGTSYYRLKQVDLNGKIFYSQTTTVKYTTGNNIYAYPTPNTGNTVNFKGIEQPKNMQLVLHDIAGNTIYNTTLSTNSIELPAIKPGIYTISLSNKTTGEVTNLRYIKL